MKSIRTKLWLGMMVLVGVVMLLLWLFQIVFLKQFYSVLELREIKNTTDFIIDKIQNLDDVNQIGQNKNLLDEIEHFTVLEQVTLRITDTKGNLILQSTDSTGKTSRSMLNNAVAEASAKALLGEDDTVKVIHPRYGNEFVIIGKPILIKNQLSGAVTVSIAMASVNETASILKSQLLMITTILLLVALIISSVISKVLTKPILKITRLAELYANGNYNARIDIDDRDEIGQLANRMNKMGEELASNEVLQKELIANVSHELRTPLTLIRGYAETLRDVTGAIPQKRELQLGVIIEESERLGEIVEDILSLSQLQSGAAALEMESFSLKQLILDIQKRYELQKESCIFHTEGLEVLTENVIGDKRRLEQVFYNLINNALTHTGEDGFVEVRTIGQNTTIRVQVRDNGAGIAKEDLAHVFERYYKGKRVDGKKTNGTGLGLAIVKSILDMHQAQYGVISELGEGSIFWFELKREHPL